jgi:hypothetical protein
MKTEVQEYRNHKIEVDEYGQFWSSDEEVNPGDLRHVKFQIDILEEWKAAEDVKVMWINYPHLQTFNVRKLKVKQSTGRYKVEWYRMEEKRFEGQHIFPQVAEIWQHTTKYDEKIFKEFKALFANKVAADSRLQEALSKYTKNFEFGTEWIES